MTYRTRSGEAEGKLSPSGYYFVFPTAIVFFLFLLFNSRLAFLQWFEWKNYGLHITPPPPSSIKLLFAKLLCQTLDDDDEVRSFGFLFCTVSTFTALFRKHIGKCSFVRFGKLERKIGGNLKFVGGDDENWQFQLVLGDVWLFAVCFFFFFGWEDFVSRLVKCFAINLRLSFAELCSCFSFIDERYK